MKLERIDNDWEVADLMPLIIALVAPLEKPPRVASRLRLAFQSGAVVRQAMIKNLDVDLVTLARFGRLVQARA